MSERKGFADRVRRAAMKLQARSEGQGFPVSDLGHEAGVGTRAGMKRLHWTIQDFIKAGELERMKRGVYRYIGKAKRDRRPEKRVVMWRFLRMAKTVTVQDLMEASGAGETYVVEWLRLLVKNGVIRRHENGNYRLIVDRIAMPENTEKAEKLRELRESKKKELLTVLGTARAALDKADKLIQEGEIDG